MEANVAAKVADKGFEAVSEFSTEFEAEMKVGVTIVLFLFILLPPANVLDDTDVSMDESWDTPRSTFFHCLQAWLITIIVCYLPLPI